jgi:hypothetical protein
MIPPRRSRSVSETSKAILREAALKLEAVIGAGGNSVPRSLPSCPALRGTLLRGTLLRSSEGVQYRGTSPATALKPEDRHDRVHRVPPLFVFELFVVASLVQRWSTISSRLCLNAETHSSTVAGGSLLSGRRLRWSTVVLCFYTPARRRVCRFGAGAERMWRFSTRCIISDEAGMDMKGIIQTMLALAVSSSVTLHAQGARTQAVTGVVKAVSDSWLTVATANRDVAFVITRSTRTIGNGQASDLVLRDPPRNRVADLVKPGDRVTVTYRVSGGARNAVAVRRQ